MKKQILFLTFFIAAVLAGMDSYGQLSEGSADLDHLDAVPTYCAPALSIDCGAVDALTPMPGVEYPYSVTTSAASGMTLHWFVTDEATLISSQGSIAAAIELADGSGAYIASADAAYNDAANTATTVNITWKPFDGAASNVILVVYNVDDANCTDNMEVFRIIPQYNFALDIAGIADAGTTGGIDVADCVNPIQSASYDGTDLVVDYGTDYVFFAVNAANWQDSWMPDDFTVTTDLASSVATITGWAYPGDAATTGAWNTVGTDPVLATGYASAVDGFVAEGCIIVRVQVDHGSVTENLTAETINLIVNGEMINQESGAYDGSYPDLEDGGGSACPTDLTSDNVNYVITPRPDVDENGPTPFENKTPSED